MLVVLDAKVWVCVVDCKSVGSVEVGQYFIPSFLVAPIQQLVWLESR